jgi:ABC-type nickel/cobalt efflux system permease component RcnA
VGTLERAEPVVEVTGESRRSDTPQAAEPRRRRSGLIGMGVAGGLVPSPSALIVLLGAIALGRTWFGFALVAAYGLGMAATLTATGLLLVKLAGRLDRLAGVRSGLLGRLASLTPVATALVVVVLGIGLAIRSLMGVL